MQFEWLLRLWVELVLTYEDFERKTEETALASKRDWDSKSSFRLSFGLLFFFLFFSSTFLPDTRLFLSGKDCGQNMSQLVCLLLLVSQREILEVIGVHCVHDQRPNSCSCRPILTSSWFQKINRLLAWVRSERRIEGRTSLSLLLLLHLIFFVPDSRHQKQSPQPAAVYIFWIF